MTTRDDLQADVIARVLAAFAAGARAPVAVCATGFGKTFLSARLMALWAAAGQTTWFLAPLDSIMLATARRLEANGQRFGWIWGQREQNPDAPIQIVSAMTAVRRLESLRPPDRVIVDECHQAVAPTYQRVFDALGRPLMLGLTGSPQRTDQRGLAAGGFDRLVLGPEAADLVELNLAPPVRLFSHPEPRRDSIFHTPFQLGDALATWQRLAIDPHRGPRPTVAFCGSVAAAETTAQDWLAAGYRAMAVHAGSSREVRARAERELQHGDLDLVACADLWVCGIDIPELSCVLWLRHTDSVVVWMQGNGRSYRPCSWEDTLILDLVGNARRPGIGHPLARRNHLWELGGDGGVSGMRERIAPVSVCPRCHSCHRDGPFCVDCGYDYRKLELPKGLRIRDGQIVEMKITKEQKEAEKEAQDRRKAEIKACYVRGDPTGNYNRLMALAMKRNYENPEGWVQIQLGLRDPATYARRYGPRAKAHTRK